MALPKKRSRIIRVADTDFRWIISPQSHHLTFVAEAANAKGQKIEVKIASDSARFWIEFPMTDGFNLKDIYPKDAAIIIQQALAAGWKPLEKGTPLRFEFKEEKLLRC